MIDMAVTLLPEPDSPTTATVSFGPISKLISLTTLRHSPPTRKAVLSLEMERIGLVMAQPSRLGLRISRSASPMRLMPTMSMRSARPGKKLIQ